MTIWETERGIVKVQRKKGEGKSAGVREISHFCQRTESQSRARCALSLVSCKSRGQLSCSARFKVRGDTTPLDAPLLLPFTPPLHLTFQLPPPAATLPNPPTFQSLGLSTLYQARCRQAPLEMCSQPLWLWATSLPWSFSGSGEYARSKVRKAWKTHRFKACAGRADGEIGRSKIFLCKQFVAGSPVLSSLLSLVLCVFAAHAPLSLFLTAPPPFFPLTHLGFLCYGDVAINPVNAGWRVMTSEELEYSCGEWGFGLVRALTGTPQLQLCS